MENNKKIRGLWIAKTGDGNAWYHIYPFIMSSFTNELHIVRYTYPQREIEEKNAIFHIFKSKLYFSEIINFFLTGFQILRTKNIDYIVSFNLVPWATFAWILAKLFKKPIIIGLIGSDFHKYLFEKKSQYLFQYLLKRTDVITVTGNKMLQYFMYNNFGNNVFIYPHCLPNEWYCPTDENTTEQCDLISISELKPNKRTIDIINAISLLKKKGLSLSLKIIGVGPEKDNLQREVKRFGLEQNVSFLGYQTNILEHLKNAKLFVQASIKEGLSLSLVEALGAGVLPIITEAGSEKDVVTHDYDSLFFKTFDTQDLANKIEYAMNEKNYRRLIRNVVKTRENFKIEKAISQTEEIQKFLIEKSKK